MLTAIVSTIIFFGVSTGVGCQMNDVKPDECFTKQNLDIKYEYPSSAGRQ